ncbi:hypothetical protein REJC140_03741 [Pseudorhizobium endolithicum]|uniref:Uncharacterized protein n=1 Tax=Pseudorhizobium endolithicum TaxID=1191678 RepID=A0ABN7JRF6_9HYPH|nr:hypothetical protein [Pseudorhizobium endolithicum]CAD7043817.1 hypothetical protein REJC140_03741 [Pseudorhizobium endolithicum]
MNDIADRLPAVLLVTGGDAMPTSICAMAPVPASSAPGGRA